MKKKWACLLAAALLAVPAASAARSAADPEPLEASAPPAAQTGAIAAAGFSDVPADAWYLPQLNLLLSRGAISGQGAFRPDELMSTEEYIKILVSCTVPADRLAAYGSGGDWSEKFMRAGSATGALKGFDCSAERIAKPVTRCEAAWLLAAFARQGGETLTVPKGIERALRDYRRISDTYREAVGQAVGAGLLTACGDGNFQDITPLKRCEAVVSIARLIDRGQRVPVAIPEYDYNAPVPQSAPVDDSFFSDAVFIGDSLCQGFGAYSGLKQGKMMGVVSLNVFRVWDGGREQVFRDQKFGKIYIMLGINEIGYGTSRVAEAYKAMVQKFQQLQPQANIYVQSLLPVCESKTSSADRLNHVTNAYIRELNAALQTVCADCQVYFVNLYEAFADASGGLPSGKCWDAVHLNVQGYQDWLAYLRTHTV